MAVRLLSGMSQGEGGMGKWRGPPHEDMPRCGARTRSRGLCGHFSMSNGRCRYHGGKSVGARKPKIKHGYYTKDAMNLRKQVSQVIKESNDVLNLLD